HLRVGLLRLRPNTDLALKHGSGLIVDHSLEDFPALATSDRVIGGERAIGMLPVSQQAQAAQICFSALPCEPHKYLIADDAAACGEPQFVEFGAGANVGQQRRNMDGGTPLA